MLVVVQNLVFIKISGTWAILYFTPNLIVNLFLHKNTLENTLPTSKN